eukprot:3717013-Heterocapsa_arctica.AAC.1
MSGTIICVRRCPGRPSLQQVAGRVAVQLVHTDGDLLHAVRVAVTPCRPGWRSPRADGESPR